MAEVLLHLLNQVEGAAEGLQVVEVGVVDLILEAVVEVGVHPKKQIETSYKAGKIKTHP